MIRRSTSAPPPPFFILARKEENVTDMFTIILFFPPAFSSCYDLLFISCRLILTFSWFSLFFFRFEIIFLTRAGGVRAKKGPKSGGKRRGGTKAPARAGSLPSTEEWRRGNQSISPSKQSKPASNDQSSIIQYPWAEFERV